MSRRLASLAGLLLFVAPALAQRDSGVYTQPSIPSLRDLDRLNLNLAWKAFLPLDGRGDGIASVQVLDKQIYVQTKSNVLIVLRASNGEEEWRMVMPKRYQPTVPVAVNQDLVLVVNGPRLYILDRANGKQKLFVELPSTVAAGLSADIQQCFVALSNNRVISVGLQAQDVRGGQVVRRKPDELEVSSGVTLGRQSTGDSSTVVNRTPSLTILQSLRPPFVTNAKDAIPSLGIVPSLRKPYRFETGNAAPSMQMVDNLSKLAELTEIQADDKPRIVWELQANRRIENVPLVYGEFLVFAGADTVFVADKHALRENKIRHEYPSDTRLTSPISRYGPDLYFAAADGNVFWMNVENFRNAAVPVQHIKRFLAGLPVDRTPLATDDSVYLAGSQSGLTRLDRATFEKVWSYADADHVIAVNPKFVYAADRRGNLVVLDKARGLKMATLDVRAFSYPITNDQDDRIFLTANNGLLVCLHDRSFRRPELLRKKEPKPPADPLDEPKMEPEVKKEPEPKKEAPKKDPEVKKEPEPKKADPKKEVDPKKDEAKKEADPKKE